MDSQKGKYVVVGRCYTCGGSNRSICSKWWGGSNVDTSWFDGYKCWLCIVQLSSGTSAHDVVRHNFAPDRAALKAGPWFPYLELYGGARLSEHRVHRPMVERRDAAAGSMAKLQLSDMDYVGQIDASGAPHGLGQCTFRNTGANHKGHFQHGAPFGPGTRFEPKEEKLLAGQWQAHGLVQGEYWFPAVKTQKRTGVIKSMTGEYRKAQVDPKFAMHAEAAAKEATELIEAWARDGGLDVDAAQEDVDMTQACKPRSNSKELPSQPLCLPVRRVPLALAFNSPCC